MKGQCREILKNCCPSECLLAVFWRPHQAHTDKLHTYKNAGIEPEQLGEC